MNFYQYCEKNNLDISQLSQRSISALGGMFLENVNPQQKDIDFLKKIDQIAEKYKRQGSSKCMTA
jgi:hypothetical protein